MGRNIKKLKVVYSKEEPSKVNEETANDNDIKFSVDIEIPNSTLLKKLILNGTGIGYINKKYIEEELKKNKLICLSELKDIPLDNLTIIYNSQIDNTLTNKFIDYLKDTIKKNNN